MGSKHNRDEKGKFAPKELVRQVRSLRATDEVWNRLKALAQQRGQTPADYLEWMIMREPLKEQESISTQQTQVRIHTNV